MGNIIYIIIYYIIYLSLEGLHMKYDIIPFIIIIIIYHLTHFKRKYAYAIDKVDID